MKKRLYLFIYIAILCATAAQAQDDAKMRQVYAQAESDYQIGRTEQARDSLMLHLRAFRGNLRQNALRLIALAYLESYDVEQTERYATLMLQQNPYYTVSSQDPPEFADIVGRIKDGMTTTVTTASNQEERLAEVPVPTTLITEEMIRSSSARNLQEVLAAYVPGMHLIDCNGDVNIGMRGIYSTTQEKLLIMLNGHRMNSYVTNTAAPDFSMSLEKIKQIEVLRGPASSLYGGVALTGVVNIITKTGGDIDGIVVKAGAGNNGQKRADLLVGKRYYDIDVMAWASVYHNKGEQRHVGKEHMSSYPSFLDTNDSIFIGRVGERPTYDLGAMLSLKGFSAFYNVRFSQAVTPFTFSTSAFAYDHDAYELHNGLSPGFSHFSNHAELSYKYLTGPFSLRLSGTYDREEVTRYQVLSESPNPYLANVLGLGTRYRNYFCFSGLSRYINLYDHNFGLQLKSDYNYTLGRDHKGSLAFGAEFAHFMMDDIRYMYGYDYNYDEDFHKMSLTDFSSENSANASLQLKNQWRSLILNAGMRYDHRYRYDDTEANVLSPRIALILLRPKWNVKFSFSQSFVDAPYLYRAMNAHNYSNEGTYKPMMKSLSPEYLKSFQLSFAGNSWIKGLDFEINGFANYTSDIIRSDGVKYLNSGSNKTIGVEFMANYKTSRFTANMNLTWLKTFKTEIVEPDLTGDEEGEVSYMEDTPTVFNGNVNTPGILSNLVLAWQATPQLKLHSHVLFEGKQTSCYFDINAACEVEQCYVTLEDWGGDSPEGEAALKRLVELFDEAFVKKYMPARAIVNLGADYTLGKFSFSLNVNNLFNTHYDRSGMDAPLMPQQGRWFMASIGVKL